MDDLERWTVQALIDALPKCDHGWPMAAGTSEACQEIATFSIGVEGPYTRRCEAHLDRERHYYSELPYATKLRSVQKLLETERSNERDAILSDIAAVSNLLRNTPDGYVGERLALEDLLERHRTRLAEIDG